MTPSATGKSSRWFAGGRFAPPAEAGRRVFGCVGPKPVICLRTAQVQRVSQWRMTTSGGWPQQTNFCVAASRVLSQVTAKAGKKQILWRGINFLSCPCPLLHKWLRCKTPASGIRTSTCKPEDTHPIWWGITGSTTQFGIFKRNILCPCSKISRICLVLHRAPAKKGGMPSWIWHYTKFPTNLEAWTKWLWTCMKNITVATPPDETNCMKTLLSTLSLGGERWVECPPGELFEFKPQLHCI